MKTDQLYYTRLDDGWGIAAATDDIAEGAKASFATICAGNPAKKVIYSFDANKNGYYLTKSVPADSDSLGRDKFFAHGYIFSISDEAEILTNYNGLLGISHFSENATTPMIPLIKLPESNIKVGAEINLYNLVEAVYEVLLSDKILDLVYTDEDAIVITKEMVSVIYSYLPLALRKYVSFASTKGGLIRKITLVRPDEANADVVYNIATGEVKGITNKYKKIVSAIISKPGNILDMIQARVELEYIDSLTLVSVFEAAFEYALLNCELGNSEIDDDEIISQLIALLGEGNVNSSAAASHSAVLITKITDKKLLVSNAINALIIDSYIKTNIPQLKESIEKYLTYLYSVRCNEADLEKLRELKHVDFELYKKLSCDIINNKSKEFTDCFALAAAENTADSLFVTENCDEKCIKRVSDCIVRHIMTSENGKELLLKVIGKSLHSSVINTLVSLKPSADLLWTYLQNVFKSESCQKGFITLDTSTVMELALFTIKECDENEDKVKSLLNELRSVPVKYYAYFEQALAMNKKYGILDQFYTEVLLNETTCTQDIINLYDKLNSYTDKIYLFNRDGLCRFIDFAKKECIDVQAASSLIERAWGFIAKTGENPSPYITRIKEVFWVNFDFNKWDINEHYEKVFITSEEKTENTNAQKKSEDASTLAELVKVLKGTEAETPALIASVSELLYAEASALKPEEKDYIISKLVSEGAGYQPECNAISMDLYLLLHYSCIGKEPDGSIIIDDLSIINSYIRSCLSDKEAHMIDDVKVLTYLYQIVYESPTLSKQRKEYKEFLSLLEAYIEQYDNRNKKAVIKRLKNIQRGNVLRQIASLVLYVFCVALFIFSDNFITGWLSLALKAIAVIGGIVVAFIDSEANAKGSENSDKTFISIFISELCLLAALIIAFSIIF